MTDLQQDFLRLLTCFVSERTDDVCPDADRLSALLDLAAKHALSGIAAFQLYRMFRKSGDVHTAARLMRMYQAQLLCGARLGERIAWLQELFASHGIAAAFVKGAVLRRYYPVPELREMGDIDLLIPSAQRGETDRILRENGFSCLIGAGDEWVYTGRGLRMEIHTNLYPDRSWNDVDYRAYFADAFEKTVQDERCGMRTLDPALHFLFFVQHLAKHFMGSGAGVRLFLDFDVFLRAYGDRMDWRQVRKGLAELSLLTFAENVLQLCRFWFGTAIPEALDNPKAAVSSDAAYCAALSESVLSAGQFGVFSDNDGLKRIRKGYRKDEESSFVAWLRALRINLFPDYQFMRRYMRALDGRPYLLPAAWVKRWWIALFRRRKDAKQAVRVFSTGQDAALRQHQMLRRLGL